MEKLIVVGEKFTDFARRHQNVLTVNEFERFVWSGELAGVDKIVIGQGVQLDDISRTVCIIRQHYPDKIRQSSICRISIIKTTAIISGWCINVKKRTSSSPRRKNAMKIAIARV